ncbi:unnamed protein product [Prunus armeniaca]
MMDFKDEKVEGMVVMAAGSMQQLREWVDGRWDACSSQRIEVDGYWNACSSQRKVL